MILIEPKDGIIARQIRSITDEKKQKVVKRRISESLKAIIDLFHISH
jgi:hypothetical protein